MSGSVSVILLIPRYLMIMGFALLAIYFFKVDGGLEQMTAVHTDFETILPHLITKYVPVGLAGLLLAGLLSAFMSTFASTVNAAPAYVVNDIYLKYINPRASVRTQIRASYLVSVLVVVISTVMGFFLKDINEIFQWIVGALFGGYIAANVLKWHWWRFNGEGYFWGMTSGVVAAIVMKFTVPDSLVLYFFPVLFGISLVGCIVGTYSAPPTDEETLVNFYIRVRSVGVVETGGGQGGSTLSAGDAQPPFQAGYVQCGDWYRVAVLSHYCAHVSGGARYGGTHCVGVVAGGDHCGVEIYLVQAVV